MRGAMRILDRMLLQATWSSVAIALACELVLWSLGSRVAAFTGGAYVLAVGLAVAYSRLSRRGEIAALRALGVSPRRIAAPALVLAVLAALGGAVLACAIGKPAVRTEYAGYVFAALQLPLAGSLSLPLVVYAGGEEPWAMTCLVLAGYTLAVVALVGFARSQGWALGLEWFFVDAALLATDVLLYRAVARPR
jgi:cell division protein FtsX